MLSCCQSKPLLYFLFCISQSLLYYEKQMEIDIRLWSRELITDLINLYKSFPCLWKIKSESYKNKIQKEQAYKTLVQFCQSRGFSNANREFVFKKIQSLRKELKKLEASRCESGGIQKVYEPSLWYFDLLLFTKDQEHLTDSVSTDSDESVSEDPSDEQQISMFVDNDHEQRNTRSPEESQEIGDNMHKKRFEAVTPSPVQYKKKRRVEPVHTEFLSKCRESLMANNKTLSEYEALGINVARKLERMDRLQAIYAESLIINVLPDGLLKKLNAESDICNGTCKNVSHTPSKGSWSTEMVTVYCFTSDDDSQEAVMNGK